MIRTFDRIVFDLDDTLIGRTQALSAAVREMLGVPPDVSVSASIAETVSATARSLLASHPKVSHLSHGALSQRLRDGMLRQLRADRRLQRLLGTLRQSHQLVLATNGARTTQRRKLRQSGLEHAFDEVLISGELGRRKPEAGFIARALGDADPARVLFVGDDPLLDVVPAQQLGAASFWVANGRPYPSDLATPWARGETVHDLPGRLAC